MTLDEAMDYAMAEMDKVNAEAVVARVFSCPENVLMMLPWLGVQTDERREMQAPKTGLY